VTSTVSRLIKEALRSSNVSRRAFSRQLISKITKEKEAQVPKKTFLRKRQSLMLQSLEARN
jgi:hypothetical protein